MVAFICVSLFYLSFTSGIGAWNNKSVETATQSSVVHCPISRSVREINIKELLGSWISVYSQPKAISCFTITIRATSEMERETCCLKYGTFGGRVSWDLCQLELLSPLGKHYLQGSGRGGVFENVIIATDEQDEYYLVEQSADQWSVHGPRGSELLVMRDCYGEAAAVFARATVWPATPELYAALHRSGILPADEGVLCAPDPTSEPCSISKYISD